MNINRSELIRYKGKGCDIFSGMNDSFIFILYVTLSNTLMALIMQVHSGSRMHYTVREKCVTAQG